MKKALLIVAVVFVTVLLVTFVRAAGEWQEIGQTEAGDKVSVSSVRVLRNHQRSALVRVEYKEPAHFPQVGPFIELRARVRFDCSSGSAVPTTERLYTRDHSGHFVVSKKANHDQLVRQAPEGGFGELLRGNGRNQTKEPPSERQTSTSVGFNPMVGFEFFPTWPCLTLVTFRLLPATPSLRISC